MSTWQEIYLGRELLTKDGLKATSEVLKGKSRVGIFFSAHWVRFHAFCQNPIRPVLIYPLSHQCAPCRSFTPDLAAFYDAVKSENPDGLEIVFVSSDRDEPTFNQYYETMPWTAVSFTNKEIKQSLAARFAVSSIPFLVILDGADGSVKDMQGRTTVAASRADPFAAVVKWEQKVSA